MSTSETDVRGHPARVLRSRADRIVGGVCGGLGAHLGIDPAWLRIAFVALTLGGGAGVLLYLIAWVAIPEAPVGADPSERVARHPAIGNGDASLVVGLGLFVLGIALLLGRVAPWFADITWPVLLIVVGAGVVASTRRRRERS